VSLVGGLAINAFKLQEHVNCHFDYSLDQLKEN
jgi:hypothetical protein